MVEIYTQEDVDQLFAGLYSKDEVDAFIDGLQSQINAMGQPKPQPPVDFPMGKIIGSGDMSAFRGLKISGHRTYNGFGAQRQYNPTLALAQVKADTAAVRRSYFSIGNGNSKDRPTGPTDWSADLTKLPLDSFVPAVQQVKINGGVLILHHEPEDDPGSATNFKIWFGLMSNYYRQQCPGVAIGLCLMAWTGRQGGPGFPIWTPNPDKFDVFCIDGYAHQAGDNAHVLFANALAYAKSLKKPLMITETGQENNVDQIPFLNSVDAFVQENKEVEGFLYWNGGSGLQSKGQHNYHLSDSALGVYAGLVNNGKYAQAKISV